jgi:hypothetical protein
VNITILKYVTMKSVENLTTEIIVSVGLVNMMNLNLIKKLYNVE